MKFKFRLQNVLLIKQKFEEQQKNEFMLAMQDLNIKEERLEALSIQLMDAIDYARKLRETNITVSELRSSDASIKYIEGQIVRQKEFVNRAKQKVEKEQEKLFEMMKERKTYEQLKEKEFEEYKIMMNAKEIAEIDELTSYTYGKE